MDRAEQIHLEDSNKEVESSKEEEEECQVEEISRRRNLIQKCKIARMLAVSSVQYDQYHTLPLDNDSGTRTAVTSIWTTGRGTAVTSLRQYKGSRGSACRWEESCYFLEEKTCSGGRWLPAEGHVSSNLHT